MYIKLQRNAVEELSDACNDVLWHYRKGITEDTGFLSLAQKECGDDLTTLADCTNTARKPGMNMVSCVIDNKDKINNLRCQSFITRLEGVIFGDYELIERFADKCQSDIERFRCGRNDFSPHMERVI